MLNSAIFLVIIVQYKCYSDQNPLKKITIIFQISIIYRKLNLSLLKYFRNYYHSFVDLNAINKFFNNSSIHKLVIHLEEVLSLIDDTITN